MLWCCGAMRAALNAHSPWGPAAPPRRRLGAAGRVLDRLKRRGAEGLRPREAAAPPRASLTGHVAGKFVAGGQGQALAGGVSRHRLGGSGLGGRGGLGGRAGRKG